MTIKRGYIDGKYFSNNPSFHIEDSPWKANQIAKLIGRNRISPISIAEVGCGAGEILVQLEKNLPFINYTGYELSPQGYELCKIRESERIHYRNSDIFDNDKKYDLLLCIDVLEHIEDYFSFLRSLINKADFHVFHIPLDMNMQMVARSKPILSVRRQVGHIHYFSKDTAMATLRECGYEIIDWFYTSEGVDRPKSRKARLLKFPRLMLQRVNVEMTARLLGGYSLLVLTKPI